MRPKTKTINVMLLDGGLGDHIGSMTAVKYIVEQYPWITLIVWMPDFLVEYAKNVLPTTQVYGFSQMRGVYDPTRPTKTTAWDGITSPMKIHGVDYAFLKLCDENPSIEHKNYCRPDLTVVQIPELPAKYAVFTTGFTAEVREWPAASINETTQWSVSQGITPVFIGQTQTKTGGRHIIQGTFKADVDFSIGINLVDKTTLLQAMKIMDGAVAVLGVDNGLLHAAGCTSAPIIGGFTTVDPAIRMPIRESILGHNYYPIVPQVDCRFCQQKTNFLYGHDYKKCLYSDGRKLACVSQMTSEKFINQLSRIIN